MTGTADCGRRMAAAFAASRREIERDLRERLLLRLIELRYELRGFREQVPEDALPALGRVEDRLTGALDELHAISRRAYPPALTVLGLARALTVLARGSRLRVDLDVPPIGRLPEPVELAVCEAVSEALADAEAHDDASFARVEASVSDGSLDVIVSHDGTRRPPRIHGAVTSPAADQVRILGGEITAADETSVVLRVPVDAA